MYRIAIQAAGDPLRQVVLSDQFTLLATALAERDALRVAYSDSRANFEIATTVDSVEEALDLLGLN